MDQATSATAIRSTAKRLILDAITKWRSSLYRKQEARFAHAAEIMAIGKRSGIDLSQNLSEHELQLISKEAAMHTSAVGVLITLLREKMERDGRLCDEDFL